MLFFFFLFNETDSFQAQFKNVETKCYSVDDLFQVSAGLLEERYEKYIKDDQGQEQPVWFLRMGSFLDSENVIDHLKIEDNENRLNQIRKVRKSNSIQTKESNESKLSPIDESRILKESDYLICTRGIPRGFSMSKSFNLIKQHDKFQNFRAVPVHHFICLRPRLAFENIFIPYLHLAIDAIVQNKVNEEKTLELKGKKVEGFTSKWLKEMRVQIPKSKEDQIKQYNAFLERENDIKNRIIAFESYKEEMFNSINKK